jgi:hypothetical protein
VNRAVILIGPRRVGKTVILHQTIGKLLKEGVPGNHILFLSLETPVYTETALETFVRNFQKRFNHLREAPLTIIFDEIQYLKDWEVHLKSLVDSFPEIRFVASGSAAAALRLRLERWYGESPLAYDSVETQERDMDETSGPEIKPGWVERWITKGIPEHEADFLHMCMGEPIPGTGGWKFQMICTGVGFALSWVPVAWVSLMGVVFLIRVVLFSTPIMGGGYKGPQLEGGLQYPLHPLSLFPVKWEVVTGQLVRINLIRCVLALPGRICAEMAYS